MRPASTKAQTAADTAAKNQKPQRQAEERRRPRRRRRTEGRATTSLPTSMVIEETKATAMSRKTSARNDVAASAPVPDSREPRSDLGRDDQRDGRRRSAGPRPSRFLWKTPALKMQRENGPTHAEQEDEHAPDGVKSRCASRDTRTRSRRACGASIAFACAQPRAAARTSSARDASAHARFTVPPHAPRGPDQDDERRDAPAGDEEDVERLLKTSPSSRSPTR